MAGMKNIDKSREVLSTSVGQTDGAVGDAGTCAQHSPDWLTADWAESLPNPLFFTVSSVQHNIYGHFPTLFCEIKGEITIYVF